ncbi:PH domain-containing protein [Aquihabitans daechungensis]|uniref:PH domain-containing protein n=1 Tax=Aquihabitans daechungensis TaxID=1052257 RepID=UPI003BA33972
MAFPPDLLNDGEEIVLDLRPHWLFMALSSAAFIGLIVVGMLLLVWWNPDGTLGTATASLVGVGFVITVSWVLLTYARWVTTHFVLTTDRIINRSGIIRKTGTDIPLDRVNTVLFSQGLLERMVGAGDLVVESASETGANNFKNVRRPNIVQKEIHVQMEANENRKFDRMRGPSDRAAAPVDPTKQHTIPQQIDQLSELHQRGVLSDAEFARKKAELLDRM